MIEPHSQVRRRPELIFSRVDDDLLALDTKAGLAYGLNASGARVYELIAEWTPVQLLCEQIEREFEVDPTVCLTQVTALLSSLNEAGLIDVAPPAEG